MSSAGLHGHGQLANSDETDRLRPLCPEISVIYLMDYDRPGIGRLVAGTDDIGRLVILFLHCVILYRSRRIQTGWGWG